MILNLSSSPHIRKGEFTPTAMWTVSAALLPATVFGIWHFGLHSLLVILASIVSAIVSELAYQKITKQTVLIGDGSAFLTGLLLGLNMPPEIPLWVPVLGSIFAIIFVKQFFGGLGRNFMNPALGGRCFLLISFTSLMSNFGVDGVASSTPLAKIAAGESVDLASMFVGLTQGTIGEVSTICLLCGGIYLLLKKVISWEIPVIYLASFAIFMFIFGQNPFDLNYVAAQLCGGGIMLGAWFMATDYVTSPITKMGKIVYGIILGVLTGIFRTYGVTAEGVSYAIIISNLLVPLIEKVTMPKPFGLEKAVKENKQTKIAGEEKTSKTDLPENDKTAKGEDSSANENEALNTTKEGAVTTVDLKIYHAAMKLTVITLVAGVLLGFVYQITKEPIAKAEEAKRIAACIAVCPQAETFNDCSTVMDLVEEKLAAGTLAAGKFGNVTIDSAYEGFDANGDRAGFVINVTDKDGFGGDITLCVGFDNSLTVTGLEILSISETAGLGMNADTDEFKNQYVGVNTDEFAVVKTGSQNDNEIDAISGATITSNAVTNGVNTAIYVLSECQK